MNKSFLPFTLMSHKKPTSSIRLKQTLNELDTALEQWDSLTNKPSREQASAETEIQKKAKTILRKLRDQLDDFEDSKPTTN